MQLRRFVLAVLVLSALPAVVWFVRRDTNPVAVPLALEREKSDSAAPASPLESNATTAREASAPIAAPGTSAPPPKDAQHPSATIRARFLDHAGTPIPDVALTDPLGIYTDLGKSDAQGRLESVLPRLRARGERLELEARHPEFVAREFERVVRPGELADLGDVVLERGGTVLGRVVDERGRPVAKVAVHAAPAQNHQGPERMSEGPFNVTNSGSTDERGEFRFGGVPAGDTRVWAIREKPPWSFSEPFPVRVGEETRGLELVLEDVSPEGPPGMRFLVRTPEGAPAPGVRLTYRARHSDGMGMGSMISDAKGIAQFDGLKQLLGGTIDVDAFDPAGKWGAAALSDVPIAIGDTELRLSNAHPHQLVVQTADGKRIDEFAWRMLDLARFTRPDWTRTRAQPVSGLRSLDYFNGSVLVGHGEDLPRDQPPRAPAPLTFASGELPFVVQVDAPGFERAEAGPFAPATAPEVITITLEPLPEFRGTVVHAKQPVAGAEVLLLRAAPSLVNGFQSRVDPNSIARTKSDAEGRFRLPFREPGAYVVQARSSEFGIGECDPAQFAPGEVLVEIAAPGRIEGRLLLPKDEAGEDWIVGASRGDGKVFSCRVSHEGSFQFEKLAPGRWLLRSLEREIVDGELSFSAGPGPSTSDLPWPYEVRSGETTRVEIDLRQEAELTGVLAIPGWEGSSWDATLDADGNCFGRRVRASGVLDGSEFHIRVRPPGSYHLGIYLAHKDGRSSRFELDRLTLVPGTQSWGFPKETGTVVLVNRREAVSAFTLRNDLGPERSSTFNFQIPAHDELTLTGVFAGSWHVTRYEDMQPADAGTLEVQPGATLRFDRP